MLGVGVGVQISVLIAAYFLKGHVPSAVLGISFGLVLTFVFRGIAQAMQGNELGDHARHRGKFCSAWKATGVGVLLVALQSVALFNGVADNLSASHVTIGERDVVEYSRRVTRDEANALGEALKAVKFFNDKGYKVTLSQGDDPYKTVSFTVKDGVWNQPKMVLAFAKITEGVAASIGGFPLRMQMESTAGSIEKTLLVDRTSFGKDIVYSLGPFSPAEVSAAGEALKTADFFVGRGFEVTLWKEPGSDVVISYMVKEGTSNRPGMVNDFLRISREVASSVGGFPVRMLLVNKAGEIKKEVSLVSEELAQEN
jgi:hypothetical protein